ncbi:MAG: DUF4340 domain-containing protein [Clostridia bacterium]|nr:DUF4340 domain-containing protein [Clostridia bacterium]
MSKRTRTLLISAIALAVLLALLFTVLLLPGATTGNGTGDETTAAATTTTIGFKPTTAASSTKPTGTVESKSNIHSVTVTTPDETFTVATNEKGYLRVKGHEDLEDFVNTAYYSYLIEELTDITALCMINSAPEHPEDFGFDPEKGCTARLDVTYTDGSTISFEVGDKAPSGEGYYFREGSSSAVYLVDNEFVDTVSQPSTSYLSMIPIAAPTATQTNSNDTAVVRDVLLSGTVRPDAISFQVSPNPTNTGENAQIMTGYYLTEPFYRNLKSGTDMLSVTTYSGFVASDIAMLRPTEADLATYGLDDPYSLCTVNLSIQKSTTTKDEDGNETTTLSFYNTFEYTVKLGNTVKDNEECRYAVVYHGDELVPMVYEVITSSLKWAEVQYDDLADPLLFFTYIDEVETFSLTLDGKTTVFELTHYPDKEDADETMKVVSNGKRYNTATFRDLYQSLIGIMRVESTTDKPAGSPVLTVEVQVNTETSRDSWVKLYRYSAGKYLAEHDTGEIYLVGAKDVEETLKQCREFVK